MKAYDETRTAVTIRTRWNFPDPFPHARAVWPFRPQSDFHNKQPIFCATLHQTKAYDETRTAVTIITRFNFPGPILRSRAHGPFRPKCDIYKR